jgi:hypothetical protein
LTHGRSVQSPSVQFGVEPARAYNARGGAGFEIVKYLTIEGHVQYGFNEAEHKPTSFAVTINFLER